MAKKSSSGCAIIFGLVLVAGLIAAAGSALGLSTSGTVWLLVIAPIVLWIIVKVAMGLGGAGTTRQCELCGVSLKRNRYTWTMSDGTTKTLCSNCNRTVERKKSKEATQRAFGE